MSARKPMLLKHSLATLAALLLAACGGGGESSGGTSSNPTPPASTPPGSTPPVTPPAPSVNRPPVIAQAPSEQHAKVGHPFSFDFTLGGTTVVDPDGDPLSYSMSVNYCTGTVLQLAEGLALSGTRISGVPTRSGYCDLTVRATDDKPGTTTASYAARILIADNSAPALSRANATLLLTGSAGVNYDATQGGTTFVEPDGDAMTYEVSLRGSPQGLAVSGTRVVGSFPAVGAVDVSITARDAYGGIASQTFLLARPALIVSEPRLPVAALVYRDEGLALPFVFRMSSELLIPLWDTQPVDNRTTDAGATLGRVLFYDKRLSLTNTVSCSSCHEQSHGFASPRRFDSGITGIPMTRNSMGLANARYSIHNVWFWDLRSMGPGNIGSLNDAVLHPLQGHDELGMTPEVLESKLASTSYYASLFAAAFGDSDITSERVTRALAQFVQALISYRSKADLALNPLDNEPPDPASVFNSQEMAGLDIFQRNCTLCHESQAQTNVWQANNGLDAVPDDPGTTVPAFQRDGSHGVFRAPSLRNIELTAPYMHDGRIATLREVIEHYNSGVKDSPDLDALLRNSDGTVRRMGLSESDKDALVAFLQTFTDQQFLTDPRFSDPFQ